LSGNLGLKNRAIKKSKIIISFFIYKFPN